MKFYKHFPLWVLLPILFISCISGNNDKSNESKNEPSIKEPTSSNKEFQNNSDPKITTLKYFEDVDQGTGTVIERFPFPVDWEQHNSSEFKYTGPNNVRIYGEKIKIKMTKKYRLKQI